MRRYQRRKLNLELDLNRTPPGETREGEEPSAPQQQQHQQQIPMIDVEAIDDDVIESSPRAFAQAKTNARRNRRRTIVDVDLEDQTRASNNDDNGCRRDRSIQRNINSDLYINLEGSSSLKENARKSPKHPEPPKNPVFNCPICMTPLTEEMSTRCGHIFCKKCIRTAINAQGKCPTCRKKVTMRELIRVFLPSAS